MPMGTHGDLYLGVWVSLYSIVYLPILTMPICTRSSLLLYSSSQREREREFRYNCDRRVLTEKEAAEYRKVGQ